MSETKAVILAGGFGTRLRPITCTRPKPMCKIAGQSVLERILNLLPSWGIHKVVISTMYMSGYIKEELAKRDTGLDIHFINEDNPLGSAGGAKYAAKALDLNSDDNILVLSGDGMFDFNLSDCLAFHKEKNAAVTIVTTKSETPIKYGVVQSKDDGKIYSITEKPSWSEVRSDIVNTGIYILKSCVFDLIPDERAFDFSRDLFPLLLGNQIPMFAFKKDGYWCDIGDIIAYYNCNIDALNGKIKNIDLTQAMTREEIINNNINCEFPCYISRKSKIDPDARIGAYSVIEDNVTISKGATVNASIIFYGCQIMNDASIQGSIICENSIVGEASTIMSGCTIGAGTEISSEATVTEGTTIWPNKKIKKGFYVTLDILFDNKSESLYVDEGFFAGKLTERVNTEYITRLGFAIAKAVAGVKIADKINSAPRIGVIHNGKSASALIAETILFAIKNAGVKSYSFLDGFEAQAIFASHTFMTDIIIFATDNDNERVIKIFDKNGEHISHELEQKIEGCYKNPQNEVAVEIHDTVYIDSLKLLYYSSVVRLIEDYKAKYKDLFLEKINCSILKTGEKNNPNRILFDILSEYGVKLSSDNQENIIKISISDDCLEAVIEQKIGPAESVYYDTFHIKSALFGNDCKRHEHNDMCHAVMELLLLLNENKRTLKDLFSEIPEFRVYIKDLSTEDLGIEKRAHVMKELFNKYKENCDTKSSEGINLIFDNGNVTVIPRRSGGFKIISEAVTTECAMEISHIIEEEIRNL